MANKQRYGQVTLENYGISGYTPGANTDAVEKRLEFGELFPDDEVRMLVAQRQSEMKERADSEKRIATMVLDSLESRFQAAIQDATNMMMLTISEQMAEMSLLLEGASQNNAEDVVRYMKDDHIRDQQTNEYRKVITELRSVQGRKVPMIADVMTGRKGKKNYVYTAEGAEVHTAIMKASASLSKLAGKRGSSSGMLTRFYGEIDPGGKKITAVFPDGKRNDYRLTHVLYNEKHDELIDELIEYALENV